MNKKFYLVYLLLFISIEVFSQVAVPFAVRRQLYVKGDMTMIANNIVNRKDFFSNPNSPYDKVDDKAKLNDQLDMQYIDIDDDKNTFSSSSANLVLDKAADKKIVYAGLYWSATYTSTSSKSPRTNIFTAVDNSRQSFDNIKIKLPNETAYTDIQGKMIFDGLDKTNFKESAPYAMYADITDLVKKSKSATGTYTVANIKSTVGVVSGGVSAGWSIFFVYEDANMSGKFITTYDGFAGVTKAPVDINFSGFQTLPVGIINAKIACAALEGDLNLTGDQLFFKSDSSKEFSKMSDELRDKMNVFNSSISIDNKYFSDRSPNSVNTLGYDSFIMAIQNPDNSIIQNNTKGVTVKFKSYGDRYFVFFNAFTVEVVPPVEIAPIEILPQVELLAAGNQKKVQDAIKTNTKVVAVRDTQPIKKEIPVEVIEEEQIPVAETKVAHKATAVKAAVTNNKAIVDKNYYLVAGVFKVHSNATRLIEKLKKEGVDAYYVTNPKNNYRYVYISKPNTFSEATQLQANKLNGTYGKKTWVFKMNKQDDNSAIADNSYPAEMPQVKKPITKEPKSTAVVSRPIEKEVVVRSNNDEVKKVSYNNKDYYLVVGVFKIHSNGTALVAKLNGNGIEAFSFVNPKNKMKYVYVSKKDSYQEATRLSETKMNGTYNKDIWVFGMKQQNNIVTTD
ncbi:SPOR domain-containing protein [Flavobacterium muglaense]|uniref:SPOR domain-containing protein n=1 Tax=Flavobacterium muglaense TaxID=2764716 RepID=A0A923N4I3_9FLAO|nr:SPOR domain-containing protein [Flavobacterium muglaense]MBC5838998.1 SPOR domain-containing protein [Flavobacterium muglaense]MBC5845498.1 SPOR domain-containing protein [Flavobacterium muglaense]